MASCKRTTWRGVIVCAHSVPKLNAWAVSIGNNILLKPLPGCGSYQTTTAASAGTHAGGGAIDIDLRSVPADKRKWVADKGRVAGLQVAWHRDYVKGLWTWHAHALDPACPNLSKAAAAQIVEYGRGGDGLLGSRPDGNTRVNVPEIMAIFARRVFTDVAQAVSNAERTRQLEAALHLTQDGVWSKSDDFAFWILKSAARLGKPFFDSRADKKLIQKYAGTTQDGVWGPATAAAVKATAVKMQKALGVPADGVWGPQTDAAYQALRNKMYTPPATTAPKPAAPVKIDTSPIPVNLTNAITRSNVKQGKKGSDVARYQAALWDKASASTRENWAKKWKVNRNQVADGVYGPATADLTKIHYNWLAKSRPGQGWTPGATDPGPALMKYLGFTRVR